jgi:hypothetical protein
MNRYILAVTTLGTFCLAGCIGDPDPRESEGEQTSSLAQSEPNAGAERTEGSAEAKTKIAKSTRGPSSETTGLEVYGKPDPFPATGTSSTGDPSGTK